MPLHLALLCFFTFILVGIVLAGTPPGTQQQAHQCTPYKLGEPIALECWNSTTNNWGPPPMCLESSAVMSFHFGVDKFQYCSWAVDTALYNRLKDVTQGHASLACRVQMAPDHNVYLPLSIPVWAFVEADHIHIDNHVNFIFHADQGKIIGAAAYPLRDRFQYLRPGVTLTLHGAVKWFYSGSYVGFHAGSNGEGEDLGSMLLVLLWCIVTFIATILGSASCYRLYLRPRLYKKLLKQE